MNATEQIKLTQSQVEDVIRYIRVLDSLSQVMDDLEACGEACQARRNAVHNLRQKTQQLLNRFGPK